MIEVFANGKLFKDWTAANVSRSLSNIAAGFSLTLTTSDTSGGRVQLWPGDAVKIRVDGIDVLDGYVNRVSPSFSGSQHSLLVQGFEKTCDLVDCCVESPVEWANKTLDRIVSDIVGKFGLNFYNPENVDVGAAFESFAIDPGTKALDAIGKICKERGILPCSNGLGKVYLLQPSSAKRGPELVQGKNLISSSAEYSLSSRYSDYFVYGTGKAKKRVESTAKDSDVKRYRPLVIVDANSVCKENTDARADWECSTRKAKSLQLKCSVKGWMRDVSNLWEPGLIVSVKAPDLFVDEPVDLLVSAVNYSFGPGGSLTNLTLVQEGCFAPQPEIKKNPVKKVKTPRKDAYAAIAKKVHG